MAVKLRPGKSQQSAQYTSPTLQTTVTRPRLLICIIALNLIVFQVIADDTFGITSKNISENPLLQSMIQIRAGTYSPLYKADNQVQSILVESFYVDRYAVTKAQFEAFTAAHSRWKDSNVSSIFADQNYLKYPNNGTGENANQPVTNVSWFAARAYCKSKGKRLPSTDEWEYVAQASADKADGHGDKAQQRLILGWYSKPATAALADVQQSPMNYWGVHGLHGSVWEWVNDFNSTLSTGESRGDSQLEQQLFCGAGAASSVDPSDYAAFMRYAFRSSLQANYTLRSLGFRCAANSNE